MSMFGPEAALNTLKVSWLKMIWIRIFGQRIEAKTTSDYDLKNITLTSYLYKGKYYLVNYKEEEA